MSAEISSGLNRLEEYTDPLVCVPVTLNPKGLPNE
jgi:hypothetical protein